MKIKKEKIYDEFRRDIYWTRIHFESDDRKKTSTVIVCASWEYLLDTNRINKLEQKHLNEWRESVIKKWSSRGDNVFNKKVHYDVYANTEEGKANGLQFLEEEVTA